MGISSLIIACFLGACQVECARVRQKATLLSADRYSAENLRKTMDTVPIELPLHGQGVLTFDSEAKNGSGGFDMHISFHVNTNPTSNATQEVELSPVDGDHKAETNSTFMDCQELNYDPATHCTTCLTGFDPSVGCSYCLTGLDLDTNCQSAEIGFEHSSCSLQAGCGRCRVGFDPMVSCRRCLQGRDMSTDCQTCLPSFTMRNGQCVRVGNPYSSANLWSVHIIGDTHGDNNYLTRSLLSTGRFVLTKEYPGLAWADSTDNTFEIIFLGDLTDRGYRSLGNLLMVRALAGQDTHGRLKIVLGNHESLTLQHDFVTKIHNGHEWHHGDWTEQDIKGAHAGVHKSSETLHWLRLQPVVYMSWGILMMHGGLSPAAVNVVFKDLHKAGIQCTPGEACGHHIVNHLNDLSLQYFEKVKAFMMEHGPQHHPWTQPAVNDNDGVLWYRGYSAKYNGADSPKECAKAKSVADMMGVSAMAVAHTTHPRITRYCQQYGQTPVFVTDTHFQDCVETNECDFSPEFEFHKEDFELNKPMVPQSLLIKFSATSAATHRCMSRISNRDVKVHCDNV